MLDTNEDQMLPGENMASSMPVTPEADVEQAAPEPQVDPARAALVSTWTGRLQQAKRFHAGTFKRMKEDMAFAHGKQWPGQGEDDKRYLANITLRHVSQKVAGLYAKNPTAVAKRRNTLDFALWDGNQESLAPLQALTSPQIDPMTGQPVPMDPAMLQQLQEMMADVQQGMQRRQQMDAIARTLEIVYEYQIKEQNPPFKQQMKQLVRRAVTTGVGYAKVGFHRLYERRAEEVDRVVDVTEQMTHMQRLSEQYQTRPEEAGYAELQAMVDAARTTPDVLTKEGLDFDFPPSTSVIVDPRCRMLKGFVGARWVAQEFILSSDDVKEIYQVDVTEKARSYSDDGRSTEVTSLIYGDDDKRAQGRNCCVWEIYDKTSGMVYTVCEGYPDFLAEPAAPAVRLERFWPFFVLTFNDVEDEENIFPPSDVRLIRDMQIEHNLSRQRLREHRDAARPKHVASKGILDEQDKHALTTSGAHTVVELNGLPPGTSIDAVLQRAPTSPIDPNLYEVNSSFEDIMKAVGSQEANMGGTSGATATETSIAESSRMSALGSNIDDLDDLLTEIAHSASQILLTELSAQTVQEIAGPGAVWPELSAAEAAADLTLEVRAGSSGRPNKAAEIQNFERLAPLLLQIPGISPRWLAEQAITRLDDRLDLTDAVIQGLPSIIAMNGASQVSTGNPATDPNMQGGQGANNTPGATQTDANMGPGDTAGTANTLSAPSSIQ